MRNLKQVLPIIAMALVAAGCGVGSDAVTTDDANGRLALEPAAHSHCAVAGQTFYVDATGNDDADGLTPGTAWRSLDRVNAASLRPGDVVRLHGGQRFTGMLQLDTDDAGDAGCPVVLDSFSSGRATIAANGKSAIYVHDTAGVEIRNLTLVGDSHSLEHSGGATFYNDTDSRLGHVVINDIDVSGFNNGVELGAKGVGFKDVTIANSELHGNKEAGLATYGPQLTGDTGYAHENVIVSRVEAHHNAGDPANTTRNTGSGILLGSVRGGRVEWSNAYENGAMCTAPEGPVGIWAYDSTGVVIEHSVSHDNHTGGPADGDGFDLDQNVSESVMQYDLSYDNDGAGFLLYAEREGTFNRDNIVRNNVSRDTSRSSDWYGAVALMGHIEDTQIYGNSLAMTPSGDLRAPVIRVHGQVSQIAIHDNTIVSDGAGALIDASGMGDDSITLQSNEYAAPHGSWQVKWGSHNYPSLQSWRSATANQS